MTESEHAELVRDAAAGRLLIGIDRCIARKFYTEMTISSVEAETGEPPYVEKAFVFTCFIGGPIALLAAVALCVVSFHWWSIAIVPVLLLYWIQYYMWSSRADSRLWFMTLVLAVAVAIHTFNPFGWRSTLFYPCAALAFWLSRCLYIASSFFLFAFAMRNHRVFNFLGNRIVIRRV